MSPSLVNRGPHRQLLFLLVPLVPSLRIGKKQKLKPTKNPQQNNKKQNKTKSLATQQKHLLLPSFPSALAEAYV